MSRRWLFAMALLVAAPTLQAQGGKIVCWTDEDGVRNCGDRVPPRYAKQERTVYDDSGRVVDVLERQKTADEIAAAERRAAEQEAARRRAEERAAYDRFLLATFNSVDDLERTRDDRLVTLDGRLRLAERSLTDNETGIRELEQQIAAAGDKVPKRLTRQLAEFESTLEANQRAVTKLRAERDEVIVKFANDIARYRELKGEFDPPPPAAGG